MANSEETDTIEDHGEAEIRIINSLSEGVQKMELLHTSFLEYKKLQNRIYRHGNPDTVLKCGRKKVSPEHKKATYQRTLERRKEERRLKAIAEGRIPSKGRPRKIITPEGPRISENVNPIQV